MRFDFYDDPVLLSKYASQVPDFVRAYQPPNDLSKRASDGFALRFLKKTGEFQDRFPTHTRADTWLSSFYLSKNAWRIPEPLVKVASFYIQKAASGYEMELPQGFPLTDEDPGSNLFDEATLEKILTEKVSDNRRTPNVSYSETDGLKMAGVRDLDYTKLADDWFALVSGKKRLFPLCSNDLVKKALAWFDENQEALEPEKKREFVIKVAQAAEYMRIKIPEASKAQNYLSPGYTDAAYIEANCELRKQAAAEQYLEIEGKKISYPDAIDKLLEIRPRTSPEKFASALSALDKYAGVAPRWGASLPDPYQTTFCLLKMADYSWCSNDGEIEVSGDWLRSAAKSPEKSEKKLLGRVSKDVISAFLQDPIEIFASLPTPEKELIVSCLKGKDPVPDTEKESIGPEKEAMEKKAFGLDPFHALTATLLGQLAPSGMNAFMRGAMTPADLAHIAAMPDHGKSIEDAFAAVDKVGPAAAGFITGPMVGKNKGIADYLLKAVGGSAGAAVGHDLGAKAIDPLIQMIGEANHPALAMAIKALFPSLAASVGSTAAAGLAGYATPDEEEEPTFGYKKKKRHRDEEDEEAMA